MFEETKPETKFNMSLAILERINNVLSDGAYFSAHQELDNWFDCLRTLKREFSYLFSPTEKESNDVKIKEVMPLYFEYKNSREKKSAYKNFWIFYSKLEEYEAFLKELLYKKGLLIIHKEDIHKSVTRR